MNKRPLRNNVFNPTCVFNLTSLTTVREERLYDLRKEQDTTEVDKTMSILNEHPQPSLATRSKKLVVFPRLNVPKNKHEIKDRILNGSNLKLSDDMVNVDRLMTEDIKNFIDLVGNEFTDVSDESRSYPSVQFLMWVKEWNEMSEDCLYEDIPQLDEEEDGLIDISLIEPESYAVVFHSVGDILVALDVALQMMDFDLVDDYRFEIQKMLTQCVLRPQDFKHVMKFIDVIEFYFDEQVDVVTQNPITAVVYNWMIGENFTPLHKHDVKQLLNFLGMIYSMDKEDEFVSSLIQKVFKDENIISKTRDVLLDDEVDDYRTIRLFTFDDKLHQMAMDCGLETDCIEFK
jgi:hypothetical protein